MKCFTFFTIILFSTAILIKAQIPNADFENWTDSGNPVGWWTNNVPLVILPITQTTDVQHGNAALKGEVILFQNATPTPPFLGAGIGDFGGGFPVAERYASLIGFYKFTHVQDDSMVITVTMYKNGIPIGDGTVTPNPAGTYTQFTDNIKYYTSDTPDTCRITILIVNDTSVHAGSVMYVDNLSFGNVTAVDNQTVLPNSFELFQNYPNPFNPSTKIKYQIPNVETKDFASVQLKVYDVLGREVETLVNQEKPAGNYKIEFNADKLTSGIYFYTLKAGNFIETKKMILLK